MHHRLRLGLWQHIQQGSACKRKAALRPQPLSLGQIIGKQALQKILWRYIQIAIAVLRQQLQLREAVSSQVRRCLLPCKHTAEPCIVGSAVRRLLGDGDVQDTQASPRRLSKQSKVRAGMLRKLNQVQACPIVNPERLSKNVLPTSLGIRLYSLRTLLAHCRLKVRSI